MEGVIDRTYFFLTTYGLSIIGALVILIVGKMVAGFARKFIRQILTRADADASVVSFTASLVYFLVITATVIAALSKAGVQTTSLVAVLGTAGLAVGLALKDSLGNFAAGVLLLVLKPFGVGDYIEAAGTSGTVKAIRLFTTELASPDNVKILVPNGKIYGDTIKNVTAHPHRRVDMVFGIGYGSSIGRAMEIITELLARDERVLKDPAPVLAVSELADSSVNIVVRPWTVKENYWNLKFDLTRAVKEAFDREGIDIPYPQQVVHLIPAGEQEAAAIPE